MKRNVDLTENEVFHREIFKWEKPKAKYFGSMFYTYLNISEAETPIPFRNDPDLFPDIQRFSTGVTLVATGDKALRKWKIGCKKSVEGKFCDECNKEIRKPWDGREHHYDHGHYHGVYRVCSNCIDMYEHDEEIRKRIPWEGQFNIGISRRIPWISRF